MFPHGQGATNRSGWCPKTPPSVVEKHGRNWKKKRVVTEVWVGFFLVPSEPDGPWAWLSFFFCGDGWGGWKQHFRWISVGPKKIASFLFMTCLTTKFIVNCNLFGRTQGYGIWFLIGFFRFFGMGTSQNFCELWICGFVALRVFFSIAKHWGKRFSGFFQCKDMQTLINDWSTYPP